MLLRRLHEGDGAAKADLLPLMYQELRALAHRQMVREREGHTLQTTALIHEAYLRLIEGPAAAWEGRNHFLRLAARCMRRILVEHARARASLKAGGERRRVLLDQALDRHEERGVDVLAVHDALARLADTDAELAEIVEMRFFAGFDFADIAAALGIGERTVYRRWYLARAWLRRAMEA
jgi:RNA polymerase sigma-70 factor (ECF subfamily)